MISHQVTYSLLCHHERHVKITNQKKYSSYGATTKDLSPEMEVTQLQILALVQKLGQEVNLGSGLRTSGRGLKNTLTFGKLDVNNKDTRVAYYFDFIAGTSTRRLMTSILTTPNDEKRHLFSSKDIAKFYQDHSPGTKLRQQIKRTAAFHYKSFLSVNEAEDWCDNNFQLILNDPFKKSREAKRPFQFLSNIIGFKTNVFTSIPIIQDASASAYQIMSYFLLDENLAKRTNLIPSLDGNIQDIYYHYNTFRFSFIVPTQLKMRRIILNRIHRARFLLHPSSSSCVNFSANALLASSSVLNSSAREIHLLSASIQRVLSISSFSSGLSSDDDSFSEPEVMHEDPNTTISFGDSSVINLLVEELRNLFSPAGSSQDSKVFLEGLAQLEIKSRHQSDVREVSTRYIPRSRVESQDAFRPSSKHSSKTGTVATEI
ncbi:hypothetical protein SADUNF_Sadunf18G0111000 [Salix dunnii]|uniref:DNA-directed RNA polymerase n=1 Tax=Salix dunnii TaxID=1413687 RepID=A0A835J4J7_9ROSI|nr:hypothetical protein SADUNF_Sadunf18G0111000 [Salix dunnii]